MTRVIIECRTGLLDLRTKKKVTSLLLLELFLGLIASATIIPMKGEPEWTLRIDGNVSNPQTLNITQIMSMPNSTIYAELYCYGAYVTGGNWTGVNLSLLLDFVELDQNAMSISFSASDGYSKLISIAEATQENVIIAYEFNGSPLPETLRLVLPGANGEFWVAMINHIEVSTNSAPPIYSGSGVNLPAVTQESPTPQPPHPTPSSPQPIATPTPSPIDSTSPSPIPTVSSSPSPIPAIEEPNIWTLITIVIGTSIAVAAVAIIFSRFRK